jgi:hypothetical protein
MIFEHVIVIKVAKGGNLPPQLFPRVSKPITEATKAIEVDVAIKPGEVDKAKADKANKAANEADVANEPGKADVANKLG